MKQIYYMNMATMPESSDVPDSDDLKTEDEPEIKDDPDELMITHTNNLNRRPRPERVKPEPPEYVKIDLTLPNGEDDMFEDVDQELLLTQTTSTGDLVLKE